MGPLEAAFARDHLVSIDKLINEITVSVTLEESLGPLVADGGMSLLDMDVLRTENLWKDINQQKMKQHALDYLFTKLATNKHERVILRLLWGLDVLVEKLMFSPREIAHALVCSDQLRVECSPFFRCTFKLLLKLIFFLDYKSNREVFNKSIEKSFQFASHSENDRSIDPAVELIRLLLSREMCLMPAYFAMHELIRSFPNEVGTTPHKSIRQNITRFMDSFARPARLLFSQIHQSIKPFCGITPPNAPGFRLESMNLTLTCIKGAMRYPDYLTGSQLPLLCHVLGQLRSAELVAGLLDPSTVKLKTRSVGLELAIVDWIVEIMQITERTDNRYWVRGTFEYLISVVITFMLSSTIRFNEIVVKLNAKLEGRTWTKSSRYVMWFVLNATSGFIGKNMLTDFVPCLRLFDILFPDAEDPDRAIELQTLGCGVKCEQQRQSSEQSDGDQIPSSIRTTESHPSEDDRQSPLVSKASPEESSESSGRQAPGASDTIVGDDDMEEDLSLSSTSAEESDDENSSGILPPKRHRTAECRRRQGRLMHLATAPVCLWQHVLRKSRTGHDHLPRMMPPALRPIEARISYRMRALVDITANVTTTPTSSATSPASIATNPSIAGQLTWKQLFVILNAYSTDNEASQLIQHLVDMLWYSNPDSDMTSSIYNRLWPRLLSNGNVTLPYGLVARGRLQPLSNHLIRTMSVHLRMLVLHLLLQKFANLKLTNQLTTPAVVETLCRVLACREVEPSNMNRIMNLLPKLQPVRTGDPMSEMSVWHLLSTLLDMVAYRLADTLLPEVRVQVLVTMVNLFRLWTVWTADSTNDIDDSKQMASVEKNAPRMGSCDIPIELFYMLESTICKLARCIQSPDSVIYGLCTAIATTTPGVAQTTAQAAAAANPPNLLLPTAASACPSLSTATGLAANRTDQGGSGASTASMTGPGLGSMNTTTTTAAAATAVVTSPISFTSYPLLMTECPELNRFTLFGVLQIYSAFDLEETSTMKAFLVEQIRTICERCGGPASLTEMPRILLSRMPDFLLPIMRQRTGSVDTRDRKQVVAQLPSLVMDEFSRLTSGQTTWAQTAGRGDLFFCILLRYLAVHRTIPTDAISLLLRFTYTRVNSNLRTLCDYVISCLTCKLTNADCMSHQCLPALSEFCVAWRVVPLDRFLLFLLTHTNYQGQQLEAVDRVVVHLFVQCNRLRDALNWLNTEFPTAESDDNKMATSFSHRDPLSSRYWPQCMRRLHELLPDQWATSRNTADVSRPSSVDSSNLTATGKSSLGQPHNGNHTPALPVVYGHLLIRLLPLMELVLSQFLENAIPLMHLIPFCRAIGPLFRFHRRPINVCYILLREHWHLVPPEFQAFRARELSQATAVNSPASSAATVGRWVIDRIRVQLIIYTILQTHHTLAVGRTCKRGAAEHGSGSLEPNTPADGLFSHAGWKELESSHTAVGQLYDEVVSRGSMPETEVDMMESDFQAALYQWYQSRGKLPVDSCDVSTLLEPLVMSTRSHGLHGHPAAWRPWNLEENVCTQTAGIYAAAVEIMSSFQSPSEFVQCLTKVLFSQNLETDIGEYLNVTGALCAVLPPAYRLAVCQFASSLLNSPLLVDPNVTANWSTPDASTQLSPHRWSHASRASRHRRLLHASSNNPSEEGTTATNTMPPHSEHPDPRVPRVAVDFFSRVLTTPDCDPEASAMKNESKETKVKDDGGDWVEIRRQCLLKASLWHAVWMHANTTQLTALPSCFTDLILPRLTGEAQLLMSFYLVAPLMGSLHAERPTKLIDLTAELYRAVKQVDSCLATQHLPKPQSQSTTTDPSGDVKMESTAPPEPLGPINPNSPTLGQSGVPLIHADTIADLLYHIKYMYVGNGVLDQVRPLLPCLRPNLRSRLKFILPPSDPSAEQRMNKLSASTESACYEGRVYKAAEKPPRSGEDF